MNRISAGLRFDIQEGMALLTLDRPDKRNALSTAMCEGIREALAHVRQNDEIRVLILTGTGSAFCSGSDIEERMLPRLKDGHHQPLEKNRAELLHPVMLYLAQSMHNVGKPSIAAINGVAAGAGLSLALLCDMRIASVNARFVASWVNVALTPDVGATFSLPRLIGLDRALMMCYGKEVVDAVEAEKIRLVTRTVPHDTLQKVVRDLAVAITSGPSLALELTRTAMYRGMNNDLQSQLYFENYAQNMCFTSEDFKEGVQSFLGKRKPTFKGR